MNGEVRFLAVRGGVLPRPRRAHRRRSSSSTTTPRCPPPLLRTCTSRSRAASTTRPRTGPTPSATAMAIDLIVRGGRIVTSTETADADVGIGEGRVVQIGGDMQAQRELDARGMLLL